MPNFHYMYIGTVLEGSTIESQHQEYAVQCSWPARPAHALLDVYQAFVHSHQCEGASNHGSEALGGSLRVPTSTGMPVSLASSPKTPVLRDLENLPPS